jgi:hypothetical protein
MNWKDMLVMLSRGWLFTVARLGGTSRRSVEHSEGKGGESAWLF